MPDIVDAITNASAFLLTGVGSLAAAIVLARGARVMRERRQVRMAAGPRLALLRFVADNGAEGADELVAMAPAGSLAIEPTAVGLLGKIRGDAHQALGGTAMAVAVDGSGEIRARDSITSAPDKIRPSEQAIVDRLAELRTPATQAADDLVSRVVASFLNRSPGYLAELDRTLAGGAAADFAAAAHSLNGAAGNLGANAMAALCHTLETLGRNNDLGSAPTLMDQLHAEHHLVRAILQDIAARSPVEQQQRIQGLPDGVAR